MSENFCEAAAQKFQKNWSGYKKCLKITSREYKNVGKFSETDFFSVQSFIMPTSAEILEMKNNLFLILK